MIQFRDQEITNEQLLLDAPGEVYYLGHHLTLRNCTLIIKVPAKALVIARTRLIGCTIEAKRVLKNFQWDWAHLKDCRFKGQYVGNDFGCWPETRSEGGIEGCDFTEAHLDETRFLECDVRTLRFPRWPYFTLLYPGRRAGELGALPWPGSKGPIIAGVFAQTPSEASALTYSAPALAKWCGTTPEAIKAVLEQLDGVSY